MVNTILSNFVLIIINNKMTLQQLEYIVAVDEYRYFVQAAEACNVTQSTLSLMVKKLEEELDVTLFNRDKHPVEVTEIGRKVIDEAVLVLYHAKQMVEMTCSEKRLASGSLKVSMISTVAPVLMPGMFRYLKRAYPDIQLHAQEMRSSTIIDRLKKAEIDMGIVESPVADNDLLELPLYHERFFAYVSPEAPFPPFEVIENEHLSDYPVWIMKDGVQLFDQSLLRSGSQFTYDSMFEGGRVNVLIQIADENGGVTLVPETHLLYLDDHVRQNLRDIINPEPRRTISLVFRKDYIHEAMMNIVVKSIKTLIPSDLHESAIKSDSIKI